MSATLPADKVVQALASFIDGPNELLSTVNFFLLQAKGAPITEDEIVQLLCTGDPNNPAQTKMLIRLASWDSEASADWVKGTLPKSQERRELVLSLLGFGEDFHETLNSRFPRDLIGGPVIITAPQPWDPWFNEARQQERSFYWEHYRSLLESRGWDNDALNGLDSVTRSIVGKFAEPSRAEPYQSKGLVVGHVQSGKTANFTGVVAKAIDAGYRLVIVLTGTVELLRAQTQRRIDMELVGRENILGGVDETDPLAVQELDYVGTNDQDWANGKFVCHGVKPISLDGVPSIIRLTTLSGDYKLLKQGISALDFRTGNELKDKKKPVYDPVNIYDTDARLAIVKKNKTVLEKLVKDLGNIHTNLKEIPVLIIDDEADQASVNTLKPRSANDEDAQNRTAINKLISKLLTLMPRAQYIGYTATPFANVFVSPGDSEDVFPKDFIVSLTPSADYMGGVSFHDLEPLEEADKANPSISNEAAFVRDLIATTATDDEELEIQRALDTFVLTGAIKLWRQSQSQEFKYKHHMMLVHESVKQQEHQALAALIKKVWDDADYNSPKSMVRLRELFENDIEVVTQSRDWGVSLPQDFSELKEYIGNCQNKILASNNDPLIIVNGSSDHDYQNVDFDKGEVWRILIGGTKLSRGFTIEGLTVTYYKRRAMAADALMQMGRWFGYRPGYKDLVRLFIAREAIAPRGKTVDLYEAFEAIVKDEEDFRRELRIFSEVREDGHPVVKPADVPPMVYQRLPWLKPTAANKMYNAELTVMGEGGKFKDFPRIPKRGDGKINKSHFSLFKPWITKLGKPTTFSGFDGGRTVKFSGRYAIVSAQDVYKTLKQMSWDQFSLIPHLEFLKECMDSGLLTDFAFFVVDSATQRIVDIEGEKLPVIYRGRRKDRPGFTSGASGVRRDVMEKIAGNPLSVGDDFSASLDTGTRGTLLLALAADCNWPEDVKLAKDRLDYMGEAADSSDVATLISLTFPYKAAPNGRIGFRVRDKNLPDFGMVDVN